AASPSAPAPSPQESSADATPPMGTSSAASPQVADTSLTDEQMSEISELPTGVLDAVEAPADAQAQPAATTPTRRSLRHRMAAADETGAAPEEMTPADGADAEQPEVAGGSADGADTASTGELPRQEAEEPAAESPAESADADAAADVSASEETAEAAPVPARRPIVRIPAGAQGVRTVDADTGELSAVQPVIQPDADSSAPQGEDDQAEDASAFGGIENPQWPALSTSSTPNAAAEATAPDADTSDEQEPAQDQQPAPVQESAQSQDAAAEAPSAAVEEAQEQAGEGGSRVGRTLLIILLAVVIALVVLAIVWYLLNSGTNSALPQSLLPQVVDDLTQLLS
ncbi:hypothetical protein RWX45_05890, partial [Actinomyces sp. MRS3W]|nr:hypothetical protein [Actinomyces sp. MRS3W]